MEVDSISPTTPAVSPPSEARSSSCSSDTSANVRLLIIVVDFQVEVKALLGAWGR